MTEDEAHRRVLWFTAFMTLRSWARHPGYTKSPDARPSFEDDLAETDRMLAAYDARWKT